MQRDAVLSEFRQACYLLTPVAIREQCQRIMELAQKDQLSHFELHAERLEQTADYVIATMQENYPELAIPFHSRWRHFESGGTSRLSWIALQLQQVDSPERGRILFDLVISSVLLDAGAGPDWRYWESQTRQCFDRSEGLAVASFHMFREGTLSLYREQLLRVDGEALLTLSSEKLAEAFQVHSGNLLQGLQGRTILMNELGKAVLMQPNYFGEECPRLGFLFDYMLNHVQNKRLSAVFIFKTLLHAFASIWRKRIVLAGINLGDCWPHPDLQTAIRGSELVPFHKLLQWLTYSLIEPLQAHGIAIEDLDSLTGLAEYRNGGLLVDQNVIQLKNPEDAYHKHKAASVLIVEWRALTVALLDEVARLIREKLKQDAKDFPLSKILQGGTWNAGRKIARELRSDGSPPLVLQSDGTVF